MLIYSQEEDYTSVGHGISQSQDSTAHNSISKIEDRHAKRGLSFKLRGEKTSHRTYNKTHFSKTCAFGCFMPVKFYTYICETYRFLSICSGQKFLILLSFFRNIISTGQTICLICSLTVYLPKIVYISAGVSS